MTQIILCFLSIWLREIARHDGMSQVISTDYSCSAISGYYVSFLDIGSAGHVDGNSSAGGGSIFFRRRTPGLFRIVRTLRAITL
jgi:hypothetical protein